MITLKQESVLLKKIKSLSELEFTQLMEELADHVRKNSWGHVIDTCFGVDDMSDEISGLEDDIDRLDRENDDLKYKISEAISLLDDLEIIDDDLQSHVDKIKDTLS